MGQLRNATAQDRMSFPGATFAAVGTIPKPQCTEAIFQGDNASTTSVPFELTDVGAFTLLPVVPSTCTITASTGGNIGDFIILGKTDDVLTLATDPGIGVNVSYYVKGTPLHEKQQTAEDIMNEAHANGASVIRKGGQVFINGTVPQVQPACSIVFDPA